MKKKHTYLLTFLLAALTILFFAGCNYNRNKTSITTSDGDTYYQFKAKFNKRKTERVRLCIDKNLMGYSSTSFSNNNVRRTITLEDDTKFYIQSSPGLIKVKFNKQENNENSIAKIKDLCEDIKQTIQ